MSADRRIGAAGEIGIVGEQMPVQRITHAMQSLEFIALAAFGFGQQSGHGQGIMGGKLRIKTRTRLQQTPRTGLITQIGHRLAGKDGIVRKTALLRAFDLAVPIGPFHQAHHHAAIETLGEILTPINDSEGALLIGLNGQTEPIPSRKRGIRKDVTDDIQG